MKNFNGPSGAELTGVALAALGYFLFSLNDALGKWMVEDHSIGLILLARSLAALIVLLPFAMRAGAQSVFKVEKPGLNALRALLTTLEVCFFYASILYLPLAEVMTFYMAAPIFTAILSAFAGQKVSLRSWAIILLGFIGVLIALRPGAEVFNPASLIAVAGSLMLSLMLLMTHHLKKVPDLTLVLWQTVGALIAGAALAPIGWRTPGALDIALLSMLGVVALIAHVLMNRSVKVTRPHVVAPLQYTLLLWGIVFGYLFFSDIPKLTTMAGAALILLASLLLLRWRAPVK